MQNEVQNNTFARDYENKIKERLATIRNLINLGKRMI
jgi:hypothetical protein